MTTQEKISIKVSAIIEDCANKLTNQLLQILTHGGTFSDAVANTQNAVSALGIDVLQLICKEVDRAFDEQRDRHKIIIKHRFKTRSILTPMGEVTLERKLYLDKAEQRFFFAVDEYLGMEKNSRIEPNMKAELIKNATLTSYGKASELVGHKVSRQTVHNLVKKVKTLKAISTSYIGRKEVKDIYIEADEDHIHLQNGKSAEVKLVYVHDGVKTICKDRTQLQNVRYFVSVDDDPDKIWNDVAHYLHSTFSLRNAKIHVSGDGAYWIRYSQKILPNSIYHIDKFHIQKSATNIAKGNKRVRSLVLSAMRQQDVKALRELCKAQYQKYVGKSERNTIAENYFYLRNNLSSYSVQNRCSAEGHVSHVLSSRMSSRPMGWSIAGAERIARLRAYYFNRGDFSQLVAGAEPANVGSHCEISEQHKRSYNSVLTSHRSICPQEPARVVGVDGLTDEISRKLRKILNI